MRGGKRPGAGRKPLPEQTRKKHICITLSSEAISKLSGVGNVSKMIDVLIRENL